MNRRLVVRVVTALLAVAMLAVPASALAGKGGGKKKDKALVVCEHGCKYRTIQKAVNKAERQERHDQGQAGQVRRGRPGLRQEVQRA